MFSLSVLKVMHLVPVFIPGYIYNLGLERGSDGGHSHVLDVLSLTVLSPTAGSRIRFHHRESIFSAPSLFIVCTRMEHWVFLMEISGECQFMILYNHISIIRKPRKDTTSYGTIPSNELICPYQSGFGSSLSKHSM